MSNKAIWDRLATTDPRHTKKVEFGRKFTSIDAQWQILRMTEEFGPVGKGWAYTVQHSIHKIDDDCTLAIADVSIEWSEGQSTRCYNYGPVRGMSPLVEKTKAGRLNYDDDAGKKAMTDALTKALSHLGVSADVFLGMYDDNKYVAKLTRQFAANDVEAQGNLPTSVTLMLQKGREAATVEALEEVWKINGAYLKEAEAAHRNLITLRFGEFKKALIQKAAA